jgi:hypothetical protein
MNLMVSRITSMMTTAARSARVAVIEFVLGGTPS